MSLEQLEREIAELAAHINAAPCRWLLLVGELDRREGWLEWGCKSCALALAAPGLRRGDGQRLVPQNRRARLTLGPDTGVPRWDGVRLDVVRAVDCLASRDARLAEPPVP